MGEDKVASFGRLVAGEARFVQCLVAGFSVLKVGKAPAARALRPQNWIVFWLESSALIPWLGGAESDEGLEVFGRPEGVHS